MKKIFLMVLGVGLLFAVGCATVEDATVNDDLPDAVNTAASASGNVNVDSAGSVNAGASNRNSNVNANKNLNDSAAVDDVEDPNDPSPTVDAKTNDDDAVISADDFQVKVGEVTADSAKFVFSQAVRAEEIDSAHIEHCIVSMSAVAVENNEEPECTAASAADGFSLEFDADSQSLVVTNTGDTWGEDGGPFQVGCASCVSAVRFTGLYTEKGDLIETTLVEVQ
ncbi:MAG: hypothetical protein A3F54_04380 [Candidatus Kerfeldbacteria bacterium RIFCSPHIGHO2_12_FULL_48_17]|uniref:Uncharacterized protein n=1 Tax=Candidatus Kerfeldbacteria bacterium RIFCSPHIGHO2_12_FULL_48_17 TaxID=1798542 RepID=A0A1G2B7H5_9BACT|nr:MAG: hypothetical protein A3F54_04380 [Candidatus Kerfeldbacteria bacterium RIFCSPHIGHO2_12_FULL_48_17]